MKSLHECPYAWFIAAIGALCFFLGNLILNFGFWQLIVAPLVGGALGWISGVWVLKDLRLPAGATMSEMKSAMKRDSVPE